MRGRSYLCARSGSVCPLRLACWFAKKCVVGGPYFKKVGNTYVREWDAKPGDNIQPTLDGGAGQDAQAATARIGQSCR
jgi:hypothetical protein